MSNIIFTGDWLSIYQTQSNAMQIPIINLIYVNKELLDMKCELD